MDTGASNSVLPAQILRNALVNSANITTELVASDRQTRVEDFVVAVHVRFTSKDTNQVTVINLSEPSGYKEYTLLDLLNFAYSSLYKEDSHHSEYLRETLQLNQRISEYDRQHAADNSGIKPRSIETVSYIDRRGLKEFLTGAVDTSANLLDFSKKRAAAEGLESELALKKSRFDYSYEKVTNDRKTIMSIRVANKETTFKLFEKIRLLAERTFESKKPPSSSASAAPPTTNGISSLTSMSAPSSRPSSSSGNRHESKHRASSKSKKESKPLPIILVPAAPVSMLNLYNAASFLQDANYKTVDEGRAAQSQGKPQSVTITRKNAPEGTPAQYLVLDYADKLKDDEWNRVVAVFTDGKAWQFTNWKRGGKDFKAPVEIFQKYRGYAVVYHNDPVTMPLANWNVKFLRVHRTSRHTDPHLLNEFWADLEKWIVANRQGKFV